MYTCKLTKKRKKFFFVFIFLFFLTLNIVNCWAQPKITDPDKFLRYKIQKNEDFNGFFLGFGFKYSFARASGSFLTGDLLPVAKIDYSNSLHGLSIPVHFGYGHSLGVFYLAAEFTVETTMWSNKPFSQNDSFKVYYERKMQPIIAFAAGRIFFNHLFFVKVGFIPFGAYNVIADHPSQFYSGWSVRNFMGLHSAIGIKRILFSHLSLSCEVQYNYYHHAQKELKDSAANEQNIHEPSLQLMTTYIF